MTLNKIFIKKMRDLEGKYNTFAYLYGTHNPNKKMARKIARKKFKQDKFYNGFYEFLEDNRKEVKDER